MAVLAVELLEPSKYMPEASMVTASLERSSTLLELSFPCMSWSSGACMINSTPGLGKRLDSRTPASKSTILPFPVPSDTLVRTRSVAVMLSVGVVGSPVNST